eukprot:CAMPEP_0177727884 /NCGR_PEP_ID=MMETSP0484_2-20121128/20569_1 /TAXON_ID=354590 /ORGANISM="Rhodomonas lens, Strain RHODO" /LENGTH=149 /DNA_ID=CAMNT_0019240587 /DNA_START=122 /DNA_END=568 /DNA_ORIENTATION=+
MTKKTCSSEGCFKRATHGRDAIEGALRCGEHSEPGDTSRRHKLCEAPTCRRRPSFGDKAKGIARFCRAHKLPFHVDVQSRRRKHPEGLPTPAPPRRKASGSTAEKTKRSDRAQVKAPGSAAEKATRSDGTLAGDGHLGLNATSTARHTR